MFRQRPSDILRDLFSKEFTPEEALNIDIYALKVIAEMNTAADPDTMPQKDYLKAKWAQEDYKARHEMEKRRKQYELQLRKSRKVR